MKISEVIEKLKEIQNSYGDLECRTMSEEYELLPVEYVMESTGTDIHCNAVPLCCFIGQ